MARRVFFSFHYSRDIWRASQVRNSWLLKDDREAAGFWDAADWESVKKKSKEEIHKWIEKQMVGTSVTVVLIGAQTSTRDYVRHEILHSYNEKKGIIGVKIHKLKNKDQQIDAEGASPLDYWEIGQAPNRKLFSSMYPTYDYVDNNGYENLGTWIEAAAKAAGR